MKEIVTVTVIAVFGLAFVVPLIRDAITAASVARNLHK